MARTQLHNGGSSVRCGARWCAAILLLAAISSLSLTMPVAAQDRDVDAAVRRVFARGDYDVDVRFGDGEAGEFGGGGEGDLDREGRRRRGSSDPRDYEDPDRWRMEFPWAGLTNFALPEIVGWTFLGLLGAMLLYFIVQSIRGARMPVRAVRQDEAGEFTPPVRAAPVTLAQVEEAAAQGDWSTAAHLLLLVVVDRLAQRTGRFPKPSETSRSILAWSSLDVASRDALGPLVAVVERSCFGGNDVERDEYISCRAAWAPVLENPRS